MSRPRSGFVAAGLAVVAVLGVTGCSNSRGASTTSPSMSGMPSAATPAGTASARLGDLRISGGYIPRPASPSVAAAYFTVRNTGPRPDRLLKVTTDVAPEVKAMTETDSGATGMMSQLGAVVIPAHGTFRFTQGHAHLMLQHPGRMLHQGDRVSMTITFARAGTVRLTLPVVGFTGPS